MAVPYRRLAVCRALCAEIPKSRSELWRASNEAKVQLQGVVVAVGRRRSKFRTFAIDDATGVIHCVIWNRLSESGIVPTPEMGDMVEVRGTLKDWDATRVVIPDLMVLIEDPNSESLWIARVLQTGG